MPENKSNKEEGAGINSLWLPVIIASLLFLLVLGTFRNLNLQDKANRSDELKANGEHLANLVEIDLRTHVSSLRRMVRSWEQRQTGETGQDAALEELGAEARFYQADVPGVQALEMVDRNSVIVRVYPREGNEGALGADLSSAGMAKDAFLKSRMSGIPTIAFVPELAQGGSGFLVFSPMFFRGEFSGCVASAFRTGDWLHHISGMESSSGLSDSVRVAIIFDGVPAYEQPGWNDSGDSGAVVSSFADVLDHRIEIRVRPTESFVNRDKSPLPLFVLVFGCLLAFLVGLTTRLYQKSYAAIWKGHAVQAALEGEIGVRRKAESDLQETLTRINWATKSAHMGIWTWDLATDGMTWNDLVFELLDIPPDVMPVFTTWQNAVHPDDLPRVEALLQEAIIGQAPFDTEYRIVISDDAIRTVRSSARVDRDSGGIPKSMTGLIWDITKVKANETALMESEEKVRLLLNSTGEAIYGIDMQGRCTFANPSCARILGYPSAETLLGKDMHAQIHYASANGAPMPVETCKIYQAFRGGHPSHVDDEVLWKADGTCFPAEYWSYPQIDNGEVHGAVVTFIDITERKKNEQTIRHMASYDSLTDLPLQALCRDRLAMAINSARRNKTQVAVLYLDLDGFKEVNDSWGHDAGDEVLREVARRLLAAVRATDTAARMGGDEFLLVITELQSPDNAGEIAEKVIALLSQPILSNGLKMSVGASIGIALYPRDAESVEALVKQADQAMYVVKKAGKNGFGFFGKEADRATGGETFSGGLV